MKTTVRKYKKLGKGEYMITNMSLGESLIESALKMLWLIFVSIPFGILWFVITLPFKLIIGLFRRK